MSKLSQESSIDRLTEPKEQVRFISIFFDQLVRILNNGLTFADNFDLKTVNVSFSSAVTNQAISHNLGRVPIGYIVIRRSANLSVWDGTSPFTSSYFYLASDAAGSVTLLVF